VFVPGKPFQSSILFEGKAGAYLSEVPFIVPLEGRPLALPANIRLGWKGFPGTRLAYYISS
jgi:hypothetical protein